MDETGHEVVGATRGRGAEARRELFLALELLALTTMVFARPVLESWGTSPEAFRVRQVDGFGVLVWVAAVVVLPVLLPVAVGLLSRLAGQRWRLRVHAGLVALLAGLLGWRFGVEQTDMTGAAWLLIGLGVGVGLAVGALRLWPRSSDPAATFLRLAALAPLLFAFQFVFGSEVGADLVLQSDRVVDSEAAAQVAEQLGDEPPPVLVLVMDELPTMALLDGEGGLDAEMYPNMARLAEESTWYRNHTSVATQTRRSLPSIVTGRYTALDSVPRSEPANLFTLLGESHDLHVREQVTDMCPPDFCSRPLFGHVGTLVNETRTTWANGARDMHAMMELVQHLPGMEPSRFDDTQDWIASLDLEGAERSPFVFYHLLLPHTPWSLLGDGTRYQETTARGTALFSWTDQGQGPAQRRLMLQTQAADELLGQLIDEFEAAGLWDDALVVVTSDHGISFEPYEPVRELTEANLHAQMWTPLLVRAPGQEEGERSDDNMEAVDLLPTVADLLGVELPWEVDGFAANEAEERRGSVRKVTTLGEDEGDVGANHGPHYRYEIGDRFDRVLAADWLAGRGPDGVWSDSEEHLGLLRRSVDDLDVGEPFGEHLLDVEDPVWARDGGVGEPPDPAPLTAYAGTDLPEGTVTALALNGEVASVVEVGDEPNITETAGARAVHGLLLLDALVEGENALDAFVVEGDGDDPQLRPLALSG